MSSEQSTAFVERSTPGQREFLDDVIAGLSQSPKTLPCKYFYDEAGAALFEQICAVEEYYPTRTEISILREHAVDIAAAIGPRAMLIEYGSGSSTKTRLLLDELIDPVAYVPVDISREHLCESAAAIATRYPNLEVLPVYADFTQPFDVPEATETSARRVVYFPGSTIGNFAAPKAVELLKLMAEECGPGGGLIIGIDLIKDAAILEAAYDDASGVTAEFNLNLLRRINDELNSNFDLNAFGHRAIYDAEARRIEMHLVSECGQEVNVGEQTFRFAEGETICTEYSHKYTIGQFAEMAEQAGFDLQSTWTDEREWFAVLSFVQTAGS